jgi:hypothetical protein
MNPDMFRTIGQSWALPPQRALEDYRKRGGMILNAASHIRGTSV